VSTHRSHGTGSLWERTDTAGRASWYGQWRTGKAQVRRRIGAVRVKGTSSGLTRVQAEAEMRRLMGTVTPGAVASEALSVGAVGELYLTHLERAGRKLATRTAVESALRVHLQPFFGERPIGTVKHEDVVDLMTLMEGKGVGPKSIRNYIGTLSALYRFAMHPRRRWATVNPCEGLELPAALGYEGIRYLELGALDALVNHAERGEYEQLDRALYLTAAMTGLRLGELIALRWADVDFSASMIRVRSNYVLGEFGTPKSRRSTRSVPMADQVGAELDRLNRAAGDPGDDALVFADPFTGGPLDKAAILRRYHRALKAAKLGEHRFHDLRHTFGTRMAAAGVAMRTLQEWMGHRDIATTQRYADYAPSAHEAALVEAAFGGDDAQGTSRGTTVSEPTVT
jgi:integrase